MNPEADQTILGSREHPLFPSEIWAIVAITLVGAVVRFAFPSAMAVEHFDEGVYASNLLFPDQGFKYPYRHLYAPSLVPALIEWSIILVGDQGIAPMLPSLLFGTLTIPLIWWVGRQWFGPLAGVAAATLLSLSDYHITFSRSALTDVPLCFWLLLAVYLFECSFRNLSCPIAIAAGVVTGLAWWTKYNGWLPLAISLSGLLAWSLFARRDERRFKHRALLFGLSATTALLVWSPYWWSLTQGYGEVAHNHRQYVVGVSGWWSGFVRQGESLLFGIRVATGVSWVTVFVMAMVAIPTGRSPLWNLSPRRLLAVSTDRRLRISEWLLAAWFWGMTLTTPLYRPYPRLAMPWVEATFLGLSWLLFGSVRFESVRLRAKKVLLAIWTSAVLIVGALPLFTATPWPPKDYWVAGWQSRTGLAELAPKIHAILRQTTADDRKLSETHAVVYVFGEPGLFFHLPDDGLAVKPAGDLSFVDIEATRRLPTFLVTGPHAHRSQAFADEFAKRANQFELVASYPYDASDFVRLDDVSATQLRAHREPLEVRLYRVRVSD